MSKLFLLFTIMAASASCGISNRCRNSDEGTIYGEIVSEVNFINYTSCVNWGLSPDQSYVFRSEADLDEFETIYEGCEPIDRSAIDFDTYSILGQEASGQCVVRFDRIVTFDEANKSCTYTVNVRECGTCKKGTHSLNWVYVNKIPNDWEVKFEVNR